MYLDHNATSPMPQRVRDAFLRAVEENWGNPSSAHAHGQRAAMALDCARHQVAALGGWRAKDVTFTAGATEANAWVLSQMPSAQRPNVVVSAVEHPSVLAWATRIVSVDAQGRVDLDALEEAMDDSVSVVSIMGANNETGVLQPLGPVAEMAKRHGAAFHCDASQLPGRVRLEVPADMITIAGHKFGAPPGIGALIGANPPPALLRGGGQERGRRAGTHNLPGIVAMGEAAALAVDEGPLSPVQRDLLEASCIAMGGDVLGGAVERLPNTCCVGFGVPGDLIVTALDLAGVAASTGSACGSGAAKSSHVVAAMGREDIPVRFSFGRESLADPAVQALERIMGQMGQMGQACG